MTEAAQERRPRRRRLSRRVVIAAGVCLAVFFAWAAWKGPASALRWTVRTWDPALRLKLEQVDIQRNGVALRGVELRLRGRDEPIFRAREVMVGPGPEWRSGRFGLLVLDEPVVSLDRRSADHFVAGGGGGSRFAFPWEFGRIEIRGGHLWLENFGDPALDISTNVDAVITGAGTLAPEREHAVDLSNVYVAVRQGGASLPLFGAGQARARVSFAGLASRRLDGLRVEKGWLLAGAGLQAVAAPAAKAAADPSAPPSSLVLGAIDLVDLQVHTGETGPELPELSFKVNTALRDVGLGNVAEEISEKVHQIEFADVDILSPTDPLKRAVTVRTVFVKFSLAGLARREIADLILLGPTIYVGEPLFEYMAMAGDGGKPPPEPVEVTEGWQVKRLEVNFGRLIIAAGGRSQVGLPLAFQTKADNISLSSLAGLNLDLLLTIPPDNYDFPAYDLAFKNVRGDLRLNYPPREKANNLVNVIRFDRGRWRNFTGRNLWASVTFDRSGINGLFGGEAYRGYVSGGFSFFFDPEAPWTGWVSGAGVDLDDLTQAAAPQHFVMSGRADFKVEANGRATSVDRVLSSAKTRGKGRLAVTKLNDMLAAIPAEWNALKRELTRVSLEAARDFDYDDAQAHCWFTGRQGVLNVNMKGKSGSRNFDIYFHGADTARTARWQQGGRR